MPVSWRHILRIDSLSGLQLFQLLRYGSIFALAILLPQVGFLKSEIGIYEGFLFFAGVVTFFWLTGLIQGFLPSAGIPSEGKRSPDLFNATLLLLLFAIGASLVLWLGNPLLQKLLNQSVSSNLIGWIMLYIILTAPATLVEYWYVMTNRSRSLIIYGLVAFGFQLLAVALPAILTDDIKYACYGLILAGAFRFIWLIVLLFKEGQWSINISFWGKYLHVGLPIAASVLLSGSAQYVDGFIISAKFDSGVFAVFRYGARELPLVALLAHALSNAMVPLIKREGLDRGLDTLRDRSFRMGTWMFPLTFILILSSYFLFPHLFSREFVQSAGVFNLYLLLITSRLLFPQTILIAMERTRVLMWASGIELLLNILLSLLLVNWWGIKGVALATVIAYYVERLILIVYLRNKKGIPLKRYTRIKPHIIWTIILVISLLISEFFILPLVNN